MKHRKSIALVLFLVSFMTSCSVQYKEVHYEEKEQLSQQGVAVNEEKEEKKPTIPSGIPVDMEYLFDFSFSDRYDKNIKEDFSLEFSDEGNFQGCRLALLEKSIDKVDNTEMREYSSDGMAAYSSMRRYFYSDGVIIGTHRYEQDNVEYISYLWTNRPGSKTITGIEVGSTEESVMEAYPQNLYFIPEGQSEEDALSFKEADIFSLDFDYAFAWQPFTTDSNEIRDITFYLKDGKVTSIEMMQPFELRYVYGFDNGPELVTDLCK